MERRDLKTLYVRGGGVRPENAGVLLCHSLSHSLVSVSLNQKIGWWPPGLSYKPVCDYA